MLVAILAGGEGQRMGGGKPQRMLGGVTLLQRAIDRARLWECEPVVVSPHDLAADCATIRDRKGIAGPLAGLAAALDEARRRECDHLLLLACDTPFLPEDVPVRLAAEIGESANCAMARSGGRDIPVCSLWGVAALEEALPDYLAGEDRSLFGLANRLGYVGVEWEGADPDPFFNINTPEDLAEAELRLS
ncbi:molybdenum cofactor guanylyltransferase [Qipengyuania sp. 1XM1-15A]|uniref:molybdenum cofactor guanylyltransferase n=1 Tax=Qipengyuania xiamenensis TaxID=2867237 RepID=UPI001C88B7F2|nr:molybdenum cofactor guanylyltransferase [Qipengyuania xiamenensis]MBX7532609.1 molybdenum cofactor guanylyltransferase [Qipengyuania xiamenensis]